MRKNGNHRTRDYAAEITFLKQARIVPPSARLGLLAWLRLAHVDAERNGGNRPVLGRRRKGPPPRTFWMLAPGSGEWHLL